MDINGKRILVLGAFGQVGSAIVKLILRTSSPAQIVLCSLKQSEAEAIALQSRKWADAYQPGKRVELVPEWGDMLRTTKLQQLREKLNLNPEIEAQYTDELVRFLYREYNEFSPAEKQDIVLYRLVLAYKPELIIDCVNTATGLAYQDIYTVGKTYLKSKQAGAEASPNHVPFVERALSSAALPALVRHIEILNDAMKAVGTQLYLKVGTTGTGGMGLNIPYTHSESKPSRTLMSKSAVAGASSLLYLLMNRTAGGPVIKEIKPASLIGWKSIGYGEIRKHGHPIPLYDCALDQGRTIGAEAQDIDNPPASAVGGNLESVFIDTGENGVFTAAEFAAITTLEQMELVTPEDCARAAVEEIRGESTGFDIVGSLNSVCLDSSYRGGVMRNQAISVLQQLEEQHGQEGVAFEILGPPRLSKLLWEAYLLKTHGRLGKLLANVFADGPATLEERLELFEREFDPSALCEQLIEELAQDVITRSRIISIGIPICTPDLKLLYGPNIALMRAYPDRRLSEILADSERRAFFLEHGAVVLMPGNLERWKLRLAAAIRCYFLSQSEDQLQYSSAFDWHELFQRLRNPETGVVESVDVRIGELIGWLFITEEHGSRRRHVFMPEMCSGAKTECGGA